MTEKARATVSKHAPGNPFVEPEGPDSSVSRTKTVMSVILYGGSPGGTMGKASEVNNTALQGRRKRDGLLVTLIVFLI